VRTDDRADRAVAGFMTKAKIPILSFRGLIMTITIHPTAIIDDGARIWHWVHICSGARIGEHCSFGQNVFVGNDVRIGNNCKVQNNVSLYDAVTLEDDVFCGPSMVFTNVYNPRSAVTRKDEYRRTLVKRGATIGANATIVCGVTLGEYAFIAAGTVINKDVKPYALMAAVPNLGGRRQQRVGSEANGGCAALIHPTEPAPL
jgi:UDP-2-acetamido-3-amino-2,3-dideoxy-glucuronate N-acetyltransferase